MLIVLSKNSQKQFNHLPASEKNKIRKKLLSLGNNPHSGKKLSGELKRFRSLKVWPYRIIYSINNAQKRIEVQTIIHRQGAYK